MLVLAPAACIMSGIALSQAFDVFTASIKYHLGGSSNSTNDVSILPSPLYSLWWIFSASQVLDKNWFVFRLLRQRTTILQTMPQKMMLLLVRLTRVKKLQKSGHQRRARRRRENLLINLLWGPRLWRRLLFYP